MKACELSSTDSAQSHALVDASGIPDLKWINRNLPIKDVARALDLRFQDGKIHCWRPKHIDDSASVGIRKVNNTVKCFGCDTPPMGPVDLVRDVLGLESPAAAGLWIAGRFQVPRIPKGKHLGSGRVPAYRVGHEKPLELLVRCGLWARLETAAQRLAPVLLALAEDPQPDRTCRCTAAYLTLMRYSGIRSPNSISSGLRTLAEIAWLSLPGASDRKPLVRQTNTYILTPYSDELLQLANATAAQKRSESEGERELRREQRRRRNVRFPE